MTTASREVVMTTRRMGGDTDVLLITYPDRYPFQPGRFKHPRSTHQPRLLTLWTREEEEEEEEEVVGRQR